MGNYAGVLASECDVLELLFDAQICFERTGRVSVMVVVAGGINIGLVAGGVDFIVVLVVVVYIMWITVGMA